MQALMNLPWYMYVILGIFVVFFVIQKVLPTIKKGQEIVERGKEMFSSYIKNPAGSNLSEEQFKAISVGAINGEQTSCYIDSLTTGMKPERLAEGLGGSWGIESSESAKETLDWLKNEGHRIYFEKILSIYLTINKDSWSNSIKSKFESIRQNDAMTYLKNFSETAEELKTRDGITEKDLKKGILAWDMGRLVIVTRMAFDSQYISEAEAWDYINSALYQSKKIFSNWDELRKSYIIGRAMWSGDDMMLTGLKNIGESLLKDQKSPWNTINL